MKTYEISRYGTRNWAVSKTAEGITEIICVTVYLKGALKVVEELESSQKAIVNIQDGKEVA